MSAPKKSERDIANETSDRYMEDWELPLHSDTGLKAADSDTESEGEFTNDDVDRIIDKVRKAKGSPLTPDEERELLKKIGEARLRKEGAEVLMPGGRRRGYADIIRFLKNNGYMKTKPRSRRAKSKSKPRLRSRSRSKSRARIAARSNARAAVRRRALRSASRSLSAVRRRSRSRSRAAGRRKVVYITRSRSRSRSRSRPHYIIYRRR